MNASSSMMTACSGSIFPIHDIQSTPTDSLDPKHENFVRVFSVIHSKDAQSN